MEKIKKKKTTLTISSKKTYNVPRYVSDKQKTSVVIEKKSPRARTDRRSYDNNRLSKPTSRFSEKTKASSGSNFTRNTSPVNRNFDIRQKAEERATKRFKLDGFLEEFALTRNEAEDLIMNSRNIVFK